jgi:hypothetical protein
LCSPPRRIAASFDLAQVGYDHVGVPQKVR